MINTSTLISIVSGAARIAHQLDTLHGQGQFYGRLIPSRLSADGTLLSPIPPIDSQTIDLEQIAHSPQEALSRNALPGAPSDLYSLGVVLYRQLAGELPFYARDPMKLVHEIFTAQPQPPHAIQPDIPVPLSMLTMELLAKSADERPQSAGKIAAILEAFAECLQAGAPLPEFTARQQEHRLKAGAGLFGRDAEIAMIGRMIEESKEGRAILAMITGPSGIGKSALIASARQMVARHNGLFAVGKYDQFKRNIPYYAIIEFYRDLFQQLLSLASEDLERWRRDLKLALGEEGRVVSDVIPEILHIIGPQPDIPTLSGMAAQLQFNAVFTRLLAVFARPEHPLVIFLDDLQWVDAASLALIEATGVKQTGNAVLLLGAYRDNEVSETHPLLHTLNTLESASIDSRQLMLTPLANPDVHQIVLEACDYRILDPQELSARILQETDGNPFFAHQYLEELHNDGRLYFNSELDSWVWTQSHEALPQTDGVMELMRSRLARHSEATRGLLHLSACLGATLLLEQLVKMTGLQDYEVLAALQPAIASGLVLHADRAGEQNVRFAFLHDRVQQAAYGLETPEENAAFHHDIAKKLRHGLDDKELDLQLFDIVDQFNQGLALISPEEEKLEVARLNRLAGIKAYEAFAFAASIAYFDTALSLLGEEGWQNHHELCFTIGMLNLESRYQLPGSEFETFADTLDSRATTKFEVVKIDLLRIKQFVRSSMAMESLEQASVSLEMLDIAIPSAKDDADILKQFGMSELTRVRESMEALTTDELCALPDTQDERILLAVGILAEINPSASAFNLFLYSGVVCLGATLSIQHGLTPSSALLFPCVGAALIVFEQDYTRARDLNQLAEKLASQRYANDTLLALVNTEQYYYTAHWTTPFPLIRSLALENAELCARVHDPMYNAWNLKVATFMQFDHGSNLVQAREDAQNLYNFSAANQLVHAMQAGAMFIRMATLFASSVGVPDSFSDAEFNEEVFIATWKEALPLWIGYLHMGQAFFHVFARNPEKLLAAAGASRLVHAPFFPLNDSLPMWMALAWYELARTGTPQQMAAAPTEIEQSLAFLKKIVADGGEFNAGHRVAAIKALQAELSGDLFTARLHFEEALSLATTNEFNMECGLIAEIVSECFAKTDQAFALQSLRKAHRAYSTAHAFALVKRIEESALYPLLLEEDAKEDALTSLDAIDAMTVTRAVMALSGDVELKSLLPKLLNIILEHSGAERACLVSRKEGRIRIEEVAGAMTLASPIPGGLLNFVINTGGSVYFSSIGSTGFPTDSYFDSGEIKSVACCVLDKKKSDSMALYMENRAIAGVFSANRREVLNWIISQAAVSVATAAAYEELHISRERFDLAVTGANDGIYDVDLVTGDFYVSPRYLSMLGLREEEFSNGMESWKTLLHPDDHHRAIAHLDDILSGPTEFYDLEYRLRHKDGSYPWILSRGKVLRDASGKPLRISGSHIDITQRKRTEAELEQHRNHLEELVAERTNELERARSTADEARLVAETANKAKSSFLANMSHELRTPLNALIGFTQIMAKDNSSTPTQKENLAIILKSGEHLLTLINSVLDLAKIESGKIEVETQKFDLGGLTTDLLVMLRGRAEAKGLRLFLDQSSSFPRFIQSDPAKLRQILTNLVGNAIKFTEDGHISLKLSVIALNHGTDRFELAFEITDTGPGMTTDEIECIFLPFEQARHKSVTEGTGLGLAIAREYIKLLDGDITVTSEPGNGSSFRFTIACEIVESEHIPHIQRPQGNISAIHNAANCKILVVEDQLENRLLLKQLLTPYGFQYREAMNGEESISITRQWQPHCILMDRRMPVMDGIAATLAIRKLGLDPQPVIIAITAHAFKEEQDEMFASGCDEFLGKPFKDDDLFGYLDKHLPIRIVRTTPKPKQPDRVEASDLPGVLAALPAAVLTQLEQAAIEGHASKLANLLANDTDAFTALKPLIDNYRFDVLADAIGRLAKVTE